MSTRAYLQQVLAVVRARMARSLACLIILLLGIAVGCGGSSERCSGAERCACYPNGTCNAGLSCLSNVCVNSTPGSGGGSPTGSGGMGGGGTASGGSGPESGGSGPGTGGTMAGTGGGGAGDTGHAGSGGTGGGCRLFQTVPGGSISTPTVFVLVDRSGSMFSCAGSPAGSVSCAHQADTPWSILRAGVLSVVEDLQGTVRFGFGAFTGTSATGQCPLFEQVSTALDNFPAISALYGPLGAITGKAETPVGAALDRAKAVLDADATGGPKYILFVTDGEPDYCNDGVAICPVDSVIGRLQSLRTSGITTLVFGIQNGGTTAVPLATLQAFANAGAGQPTAPVVAAGDDVNAISDQCQSIQPWRSDLMAVGKTFARGVTLGDYASGGNGSATVYQPNPADGQSLETLIATTVGALKSCSFDLVNGLAVDVSKADQATVLIENQTVPRNDANGWRMATATRLQLTGTACSLWRQPTSRSIDFQFPCGVVTGN